MRLPEFTQGEEYRGVKRLAPDIPEQLELAKRIDHHLQSMYLSGIDPVQRTRVFKDYRSPQPGGGIAHVSVGYSDTQQGRYMSEVQTYSRSAGIKSHYSLLGDSETWLRTSKTVSGKSLGQNVLDPEHMLIDMLEYSPENGAVASLQDGLLSARALASALFTDMSRSAHYKAGSDHYRTTLPLFTSDGSYASARHIELIDGRINNRIKRSLSVTALANFGPGPVDIQQRLIYEVDVAKNGSIRSDGIQLVHSSSDGLSPQALANLAESSDAVSRRIDILHKALDDLARDAFAA